MGDVQAHQRTDYTTLYSHGSFKTFTKNIGDYENKNWLKQDRQDTSVFDMGKTENDDADGDLYYCHIRKHFPPDGNQLTQMENHPHLSCRTLHVGHANCSNWVPFVHLRSHLLRSFI